MGKFNHISNSFKSGEFSPKMRGRTDLDEYRTSAEKLLNVIPMKQGGLNKRSGSRYSCTLTGANNIVKTIPFIFSKTEAYVVTIDTLGMAPAPASVTTNPNFIYDPTELDRFFSVPASSFVKIVRNDNTLANVNGELGRTYVNESGYTDSTVINNNIFHYRPYPVEIFNIQGSDPRGFHYAQSADVMVVTHSSGDIPPFIIARTSLDTFEVEWFHEYNLRVSYGAPYTRHYYPSVLRSPQQPVNITEVTLRGEYVATHRIATIGGGGFGFGVDEGDVNVYDVINLFSNRPIFDQNSIGKTYIIQTFNGSALIDLDFVVVQVTNAVTAVGITSRLVSGVDTRGATNPPTTAYNFPATDNWSEAAWGNGNGFPRTVCFFEQRLIFGGSKLNVDSIWASRTGNIFVFLAKRFLQDNGTDVTGLRNFIPTNIPDKDKVVDIFGNVNLETDPLSFKPSSQEINAIQWLSSGQSLMVGTLGAEYVVSGANSALSATSITFRRQTSRGGSPIMPVRVDDEVFYILRDGRGAYNFKFNRNNGSFVSQEVSLHADHIVDIGDESTVAQFVQVEYCSSRHLILCVTSDNYLVGFTYSPQNKTLAWHRLEFDAKVLSVCSIPSKDGDIDEIWICAERNGVRTLESVGIDFKGKVLDDPNNPSLFLDNHRFYRDVLAGFTDSYPHLIDKEVDLYVDGQFVLSKTLTALDNSIDIPICNTAVVGLPFEAVIESNDLNSGGDFGSPIGNIQRIDRVTSIFYNTVNVEIGRTDHKTDPVKNMGVLTTGNRSIDFPAGSSEDGAKIKIISKKAFPMTVLAFVARGVTSDR